MQFKNKIDLDIEFLGVSFSFKNNWEKSNFSRGMKIGMGGILSLSLNDVKYVDGIYVQPIINYELKGFLFVETGPRLSVSVVYNNESLSSEILMGWSSSVFIRLWKIQLGSRFQISYLGGNSASFDSAILYSLEPLILRLSLKK